MIVQHCECTKCHWTVCFIMVKFMLCEFHLNKKRKERREINRHLLRPVKPKGASARRNWTSLRESRDSDHILGPGSEVVRHARAEATALCFSRPHPLLSLLLWAYLLSSFKVPWPFQVIGDADPGVPQTMLWVARTINDDLGLIVSSVAPGANASCPGVAGLILFVNNL